MSIIKGIKILSFLAIIFAFLYLNVPVSFAEDENVPEITTLTLGNWGTYQAADIWMTCGADFENVTDDSTVQLFLTDSIDKTESSSILSGPECSIKDVPKSYQLGKVLGEKHEFGFLIHDLEPGQYYVGCKVSNENNIDYKYSSFIIYPCAKDYVKAALDKIIYSYIKEPDGWYWQDGQYVGLGYRTDLYGNSWESWMFPALGTHYTMNNGTVLDFSKDGSVLSAYDGRWFKDLASDWPIKGKQSKLWEISLNELSKHILAFAAYGEDPRQINNLDIVSAETQYLYNLDGTVMYDENGEQSDIDEVPTSYMLLALEVVGATPQEGYTRLVREALVKAMWERWATTPVNSTISTPDNFAMAQLALPMFSKYPEYNELINKTIEKINAIIDYNIFSNGAMTYSSETNNNEKYATPNADSLAVVINSLVINGLRVEDFDKGLFTKQYGSLLTSLGSCVIEGGAIYGDETNRMATYQTLGALIDLYNNKSCFEIAAEKYRNAYPKYFEDNYGKLSIKFISDIEDKKYTGKDITPEINVVGELPTITPRKPVYGTVLPTERILEKGLDYTVEYKDNIEPGKATVVITGIGDYYGTLETSFNIIKEEDEPVVVKKRQPMTVKPVPKKVSFKKLKKKAQVVKGALIVKSNKGKVSYKKIGGSKKLTINKKTGRITVKKKTKKGTYKIRVKVTAAGDSLFKAGSRTVTVKIRVA